MHMLGIGTQEASISSSSKLHSWSVVSSPIGCIPCHPNQLEAHGHTAGSSYESTSWTKLRHFSCTSKSVPFESWIRKLFVSGLYSLTVAQCPFNAFGRLHRIACMWESGNASHRRTMQAGSAMSTSTHDAESSWPLQAYKTMAGTFFPGMLQGGVPEAGSGLCKRKTVSEHAEEGGKAIDYL